MTEDQEAQVDDGVVAVLQMLDSDGFPVGDPIPISTVPLAKPKEAGPRLATWAGLDFTNKTAVVERRKGLGDVIFALSAAYAFARRWPSVPLTFVSNGRSVHWLKWYHWLTWVAEETPRPQENELQMDLTACPVEADLDRAQLMGQMLGVEVTEWPPPPDIPDELLREACALGIPEGAIALGPWCQGTIPTRRLEPGVIAQFVRLTGRPCVLFHSAPMPEYDDVPGLLNLSGQLPNEEMLLASVAQCAAVISVDAGLAHVGLLLRRPTVGVFTHIDPSSRWGCAPPHVALIADSDCAPCGDFARPPDCHNTQRYAECATDVSAGDLAGALAIAERQDGCHTLRRTGRGLEPADRLDVMVCAPCIGAGGGERHLAQITAGLAERGYRIGTLICEGDDGQDALAGLVGGRLLGRIEGGEESQRVAEIRRHILRERPLSLVFYKRDWALQALDGLSWRPQRIVCLHHTQFPHERALYGHPVAQRLVDAHVCVSQANAEYLLQGRADPRVLVIPHGVPVEGLASCLSSARQELGIPEDAFVCGYVGRVSDGKNPCLLVEALKENPTAWCLFVGSGDQERAAAQELAERYGLTERCLFVGAQADVGPYYQALDLCVVPTRAEGAIPFTMLEAAACGVPVAITPVSDIPQVFEDDKSALFLGWIDKAVYPPGLGRLHVDSAISWAITHRRELAKIGQRGQQIVKRRFGLRRFVDDFEAALTVRQTTGTARKRTFTALPLLRPYPGGHLQRLLLLGGYNLAEAIGHIAPACRQVADQVRYLPYMGEEAKPKRLRDMLREWQPEAILGCWWNCQDEESLALIRAFPGLKVWWNQDEPHRLLAQPDRTLRSAEPWDVVLASDDSDLVREAYCGALRKRLYWLPGVYPKGIIPANHPELTRKYRGQVLVAMTCYRRNQGYMICGRDEMLLALESAGLNVNLWGTGWPGREVERLPYEHQFYAYDVRSNEISMAHHIEAGGCHYLSDRDVHACGSAAFLFSDRAGQLPEVFREDREAVYWGSIEELVAKAHFWLPRLDARQQIARQARERALDLFSVPRVAALLRDIVRGEGIVGAQYETTAHPARVVLA